MLHRLLFKPTPVLYAQFWAFQKRNERDTVCHTWEYTCKWFIGTATLQWNCKNARRHVTVDNRASVDNTFFTQHNSCTYNPAVCPRLMRYILHILHIYDWIYLRYFKDSPFRRVSGVCKTIYFTMHMRIDTRRSVGSAARMKQLDNHWTNYHEVWWNVLLKCRLSTCDLHTPWRMSSVIREQFYKYWTRWQIHIFYSSNLLHICP